VETVLPFEVNFFILAAKPLQPLALPLDKNYSMTKITRFMNPDLIQETIKIFCGVDSQNIIIGTK